MEPVVQLRLRGIAIIGGWGPGDYNSLADLVLETADLDRLRALVQADNAEGFLVFYSLVAPADYPIPLHCIRWIVEYYDCLRTSENLAIEAFRGSLKTTVMTIYLTAYRIGCSPHLENLFAQGNHRAAVENAQTVASIVKDQPMFRLLFPHVSPDIDKGWGADGYQVMRTDLPYGEWRQMRTKTPTLVGAGYKDALVLGKHPRGHGILDDVNNYLNTRSQRELNAVVHKVEKEIRPGRPTTWGIERSVGQTLATSRRPWCSWMNLGRRPTSLRGQRSFRLSALLRSVPTRRRPSSPRCTCATWRQLRGRRSRRIGCSGICPRT